MVQIPEYDIIPIHTLYDDDTVRAIGELFLVCAGAEGALLYLLNRIQSHPHAPTINGLSSLTGMPNKLMLEKISTGLSVIAPHHHAELEPLCDKIRRIFEHRNNLAHSTAIGGSGKKIVVLPMKLRHPVSLKEKTYNPSQLRDYANRLMQLVRHLSERMKAIGVVHAKEFALPTFVDAERLPFQAHPPLAEEPIPPPEPSTG